MFAKCCRRKEQRRCLPHFAKVAEKIATGGFPLITSGFPLNTSGFPLNAMRLQEGSLGVRKLAGHQCVCQSHSSLCSQSFRLQIPPTSG